MKQLTKEKKEILVLLEKLWKKYPGQRLGQLLENFIFTAGSRGDETSIAVFYQEDYQTLEILKCKLKK